MLRVCCIGWLAVGLSVHSHSSTCCFEYDTVIGQLVGGWCVGLSTRLSTQATLLREPVERLVGERAAWLVVIFSVVASVNLCGKKRPAH
jgi:hypothetical protein